MARGHLQMRSGCFTKRTSVRRSLSEEIRQHGLFFTCVGEFQLRLAA